MYVNHLHGYCNVMEHSSLSLKFYNLSYNIIIIITDLDVYWHTCTLFTCLQALVHFELLYYRPSACMTMCCIHCCSSGFKLFYPEDPLWIVRGEGQYLYNQQGRKYLDCVNNINHGMCIHTYLCVINGIIFLYNYGFHVLHETALPLLEDVICLYSFIMCDDALMY